MQPTMNKRPNRTPSKRSAPRTAPSHATTKTARWKPLVGVALVVVLASILVGMLVNLGRCSAPVDTAGTAPYVSPYDWAGLQQDGDRLSYYEDGQLRSQVGVDVSDHQGVIDWQSVASDGIDFAFVRAGNRGYTEGALYADERFAENLDGAQAAGLNAGVYFFSQAVTPDEAREEADLVVELLAGRTLQLPVAFDHEPVTDAAGRANNMMGEELAACARAFCERIEAAGYSTLIYGNKQDIAHFGGDTLDERPVWLAEYDVAPPTAQFDFIMWQYTNGGTVAGIPTSVDLNILFTVS